MFVVIRIDTPYMNEYDRLPDCVKCYKTIGVYTTLNAANRSARGVLIDEYGVKPGYYPSDEEDEDEMMYEEGVEPDVSMYEEWYKDDGRLSIDYTPGGTDESVYLRVERHALEGGRILVDREEEEESDCDDGSVTSEGDLEEDDDFEKDGLVILDP